MVLKDLFGNQREESLLSVQTLLEIYNLPIVADIYHNQLLDLKSDDRVADITNSFSELYDNELDSLELQNFLFYFHQEGSILNLTISYCHLLAVNEAVFEQIHFYFDVSSKAFDEVLVGYQENSNINKAPDYLDKKSQIYQEKAFPWFVFMYDYLLLLNDYVNFDDSVSALVNNNREEASLDLDREYHIKSVFHQGIWFKVVSPREGLALLKEINSVKIGDGLLFDEDSFNFENEDGFFLVAEDDVTVDYLDIQYAVEGFNIIALGYIFLGNLRVKTSLFSREVDAAPSLIVMKELYAQNTFLCGNTHYIGGDVRGEMLYAKGKYGSLYVKGTLLVTCIVTNDMACYINKVNAGVIISDNNVYGIDLLRDEHGFPLFHLNLYPTTHRAKEVFIDEIQIEERCGQGFPNEENLIDCFIEGRSVLKSPVHNNYDTFEGSIDKRFDDIFNLIRTDSLKIDDGHFNEYFYTIFEYGDKHYREVGRLDKLGHYQVRILHCLEDYAYEAMVEFYQDDNKTFISAFKSRMSDNFTSTNTAKCTFNIAEELIFKKFKG